MEKKLDTVIDQLTEVKIVKNKLETALTKRLERLEESHQKLMTQINLLQNVNAKQKSRLDFLDFQVRRKNLVLFGLREPVGETRSQLCEMVYELVTRHMDLHILRYEFDHIARLGVKKSPYHNRPVVIRMTNEQKKRAILRKAQLLKRFRLHLHEDYNRETIEKRKLLKPIVQRLRNEQRGTVTLHRDRIYLNGRLYNQEEENRALMDTDSGNEDGPSDAEPDVQIIENPIVPTRNVQLIDLGESSFHEE